jgi:hypothetical protein
MHMSPWNGTQILDFIWSLGLNVTPPSDCK